MILRTASALRTCMSLCETWQNTSNMLMICPFCSVTGDPSSIALVKAAVNGSSSPSRMNMRQKSFFVVGDCKSNTELMPFNAWTTSSVCSA